MAQRLRQEVPQPPTPPTSPVPAPHPRNTLSSRSCGPAPGAPTHRLRSCAMLPLCALLLAAGLTLVEADNPVKAWTYNMKCHECTIINSFRCTPVRVCEYETRRCFTLSIRLSPRELIVFKNCTDNCTFVYKAHQPPPASYSKVLRTNSFYWINCCNGLTCNEGGPTNTERDIVDEEPIEEEIESAVFLWSSGLLLTFTSILVGRTLT